MRPESRALLYDINAAITLIFEFTGPMDWPEYQRDSKTQSAVERQFVTIGEAVRRLALADAETSAGIPHQRTIISFRNVLVHAYDRVEDEVVWGVIQRNLPELRERVQVLLAQG